RWRNIKITARAIRFISSSAVGNHYKIIGLAFLQYRINAISLSAHLKRQRARRGLVVSHAEHIRNGNRFRRLIPLEARFDSPLRIDWVVLQTSELAACLAFCIFNSNADALAALHDVDNQRPQFQNGWPTVI